MTQLNPFDELGDLDFSEEHEESEPDIPRPATEIDLRLAGLLSTVWPMSHRYPADSLHLAIFVRDHVLGDPSFGQSGDSR